MPRQLPLRARPRRRRRPRRGCASCAPATASCEIDSQRPVGPGRRRQPLRRRARRRRRPRASRPSRPGRRSRSSALAGLDAVNFGPGEPAQAHRRDESVEIAALVRAYARAGGVRRREALPRARRPAHLPVRAPHRGQARGCAAAGVDRDRLRHGRAARGDAGLHPRGARATRSSRSRAYPLADGLPELREAIAALGRRAASARARPGRPRSSRRSAPRRRSSTSRRCSAASRVAVPAPAYPVYERGAVFAGARSSSCRCAEDAASCPTSTPCPPRPGARRRAVAQLPEQPDRARPRRSRSTSAPPRSPASTTSSLASDEAYSELYFGDEPPASALQVADRTNVRVFNTLSKRSSMPGYRSGFVAGDPELIARAQALPAERRRRAAGVRPARRGRRLGRRGARRGGPRRATAPSATCCCPRCEAPRPAHAGGDATFFLWLDAAPTPSARRAAARARRRRRARARTSARPAAATCGWRSCRRSPSASAPPSGSSAARRLLWRAAPR